MEYGPKFWIMIATVIFIAAVYKKVAKGLGASLDNRADRIQKELDEAIALKEEAQALLASYQRKQKQALEESEEILDHANRESERIIKNAKDKVEEDISRRTDMALQKIAQLETQASQRIKEKSVDVTINTARSLIVEHLGNDVSADAIDSAISDIEQKIH